MSTLVLHMDKFKKEAVRGIQSHNRRERESHSNPDIDYGRSSENCEFCATFSDNYLQTIQNRIDDLLLVKAVRKDAVHMCGIIISSDKAFFDHLNADETRRFFEEAAKYLTDFVGKENVISAMVHMDEKTPHMHFLHVPVTKDGRLCAKDIYTKAALKQLQDELPKHLQKCGFQIERGVEQQNGSAKKHLDTREFKQQQEMFNLLQSEAENLRQAIKNMDARLEEQKAFIAEIEEKLNEKCTLRPANIFNYKEVLAEAEELITNLKHALADKNKIAHENDLLVQQADNLLRDREKAREYATRAVAILNDERKNYENTIQKLKEEKMVSYHELDCMRSFILLNDFVERYSNFQKERQAQREAANESNIRQQSQMANSSGRQRMR